MTISLNGSVVFECQQCGGCCRYVAGSIMLEPMDAYYLARYLREQGEPVTGPEDVLAMYAHASWLEDILSAADELNGRPRKKLGYHTPEELFEAFLDRVYAT